LFNQLFTELKGEMVAAALDKLPTESDLRAQMLHVWSGWLRWATSCPEKRRTYAHLDVSDDVTAASHHVATETMASIAKLVERSREHGPMRAVPLGFVVALMSALADTTIDFMIRDPATADEHCIVAFDAMWRMVT